MAVEVKKIMATEIKKKIKEAGWSVVKTAALSAAITAGVSSAFPAIGFTNGVVASSVVSIYQRNYLKGHIIGISPLSLVKKAGIKGLTVATKVGITAASVAATGICSACRTIWNKSKRKQNVLEKSKELPESDKCSEEDDVECDEDLQEGSSTMDSDWVDIQYPEDQTLEKEDWKSSVYLKYF